MASDNHPDNDHIISISLCFLRAADDKGFDYGEELKSAVKRAMELCSVTGQPLNNNSSCSQKFTIGNLYDWNFFKNLFPPRKPSFNGETTNQSCGTHSY